MIRGLGGGKVLFHGSGGVTGSTNGKQSLYQGFVACSERDAPAKLREGIFYK